MGLEQIPYTTTQPDVVTLPEEVFPGGSLASEIGLGKYSLTPAEGAGFTVADCLVDGVSAELLDQFELLECSTLLQDTLGMCQ